MQHHRDEKQEMTINYLSRKRKKKKEKLTQGQMRQNAGNHDIQPECKSQTEQSRTKTGVFHQVR